MPLTRILPRGGWSPLYDRIGAAASLVCGLHCAAVSALLLFHPLLWLQRARYAEHIAWLTGIEIALAVVSIGAALLALPLGWRRHRRRLPVLLGMPGLVLVCVGVFSRVHYMPFVGSGVVLGGGLLLVAAHLVNARLGCRTS
ncbi:MerC domain-containing protein [Coralloluteibacterium stylophorae]|uniref:MerC domain-containing protein n=1 Tax=Coralloluteibacterium stylophorae TaxID=1776034 RepID=A0A8J8AZF9_9GAMM|nr:MerC domain-containing protein [Coralloluteibacterium stylophorae]MBS7458839.1 MerC domain-containing protein [Coralloluteibacterium stylophorae]